jgi:hypothetical protein
MQLQNKNKKQEHLEEKKGTKKFIMDQNID